MNELFGMLRPFIYVVTTTLLAFSGYFLFDQVMSGQFKKKDVIEFGAFMLVLIAISIATADKGKEFIFLAGPFFFFLL